MSTKQTTILLSFLAALSISFACFADDCDKSIYNAQEAWCKITRYSISKKPNKPQSDPIDNHSITVSAVESCLKEERTVRQGILFDTQERKCLQPSYINEKSISYADGYRDIKLQVDTKRNSFTIFLMDTSKNEPIAQAAGSYKNPYIGSFKKIKRIDDPYDLTTTLKDKYYKYEIECLANYFLPDNSNCDKQAHN